MPGSKKKLLTIALMLAMFLAAVEGTVVTLAIPTIVADLQGFDLISLLFSVYLLTSAIATPIYGKLSDLYGRKLMLNIGIVIFLVGSICCGLSQNMLMLIIARALQGLGSGAIFTLPFTIIGDVFPLQERGKVQGIVSMVWGIASLVGPFLGGVIIDLLSWHWIFFINLPFGLISIVLLDRSLKENFEKTRHHIDMPGIIVLSAALLAFLSIFVFASSEGIRLDTYTLVSVCVTVGLLFAFYRIERRSPEPIVDFGLFTKANIYINIVGFLVSAALIGIDVYLPIYLQNVQGLNPTFAGLALLPMSVSWMLASTFLGKPIIRFGGKAVNLVSAIVSLITVVPMMFFVSDSSLVFVVIIIFLSGFGFGAALTTMVMILQESVTFEQRGSAIAVHSLIKTLGQTIGISIFGGMFNAHIVSGFAQGGITQYDLGNLYDLTTYQAGVTWEQIRAVMSDSIHYLFIAVIVITALAVVFSVLVPRIDPVGQGTTD